MLFEKTRKGNKCKIETLLRLANCDDWITYSNISAVTSQIPLR